ncbi:MAG TPA: zf-HC2 domain-containing protein [Blastocatellia bacterium]|nr:zf-HC2 domain-containing protein [Blastocatellia bacterium]
MTRQEIERHDVIEPYLRGELGPEERRAFQEHFFECDECLEALQATERFIAGVRCAAGQGWLDPQTALQPAGVVCLSDQAG